MNDDDDDVGICVRVCLVGHQQDAQLIPLVFILQFYILHCLPSSAELCVCLLDTFEKSFVTARTKQQRTKNENPAK